MVKEGAKKVAALVASDTGTMIGGVHLTHGAETLTGRPANDDIGAVDAENPSQLRRGEAG